MRAMSSKRKATPPIREAKLTHLLGNCLGDDQGVVHALVYVLDRRRFVAEAQASLTWAARAAASRLKKGVYASANSKALVSQLQGVVASLEEVSSLPL
jgi:hypothetical protein